MTFTPTPQQAEAIVMARTLVKQPHDRPRVAVLAGYAGTGKTTLLRLLAQEIGGIAIVAPTGKAALRVKEATGLSASTIHRFIYKPFQDPLTGEVKFQRAPKQDMLIPDSRVIVVEEASMVGEELWNDLYDCANETECHLLCVGDPYQLPPVEPGKVDAEPFGVLESNFRFDYRTDLTQVMRQALDSPIIRASMAIREGDVTTAVMELPRIRPQDLVQTQIDTIAGGGVVICHKNTSRHELNRRVREQKKYGRAVHDGEPLLVLKNNYVLHRFNGEVVTFAEWKQLPGRQYEVYDEYKGGIEKTAFGVAIIEGQEAVLATSAITGGMEKTGVRAIERTATSVMRSAPYLHVNYGYTLTAHKSQGSEWPKVLVVVEPSVRPETKDGRRWLYTATTRAQKELTLAWNVTIS
jgi:exodeoxyribonuclease-5